MLHDRHAPDMRLLVHTASPHCRRTFATTGVCLNLPCRCAPAVWDTPGFTKKLTSQQLAEKRLSEIKNGRLAMIGMVRRASPHLALPHLLTSPWLRPPEAGIRGWPRPATFGLQPLVPTRRRRALLLRASLLTDLRAPVLPYGRRPSAPQWPSRGRCRCSRARRRSRALRSPCPSAPSKPVISPSSTSRPSAF